MGTLLIISNSHDIHVDHLSAKSLRRKIPVVRLNTDLFPKKLRSTLEITGSEIKGQFTDNDGRKLFSIEEISAVWLRKVLLDNSYFATFKENERFVARETAISGVVYKTLGYPFISETRDVIKSVYTTKIDWTPDLDESIKATPCMFQEYIDKDYELRVTVVGEKVFAIKIFSQDYPETRVDWRRCQNKIKLRQESVQLEPWLEKICLEITRKFNLVFGALDFIVCPSGETVFLEINPNGNWLWLEKILGLPISDALLDVFENS